MCLGVALVVTTVLALMPTAGLADEEKKRPKPQRTSASEMRKYEITGSARGNGFAKEATDRWASKYGVYADTKALTVHDFGTADSPDVLVSMADSGVESVFTEVLPDGSVRVGGVFSTSTTGDTSDSGHGSTYAGWSLRDSNCFARVENNTGWLDHCYQISKLEMDGDSVKDYYTLHHYATAKSKSIWTLKSATIGSSKKSGSASMEWFDWAPGADRPFGNCGSTTISISVGGIGISKSYASCPDKWDINKSSTAGTFENSWRGSAQMSEREVAYMQTQKTPQGGWPVWNLSTDFYAW
jgi:hypothetical protein